MSTVTTIGFTAKKPTPRKPQPLLTQKINPATTTTPPRDLHTIKIDYQLTTDSNGSWPLLPVKPRTITIGLKPVSTPAQSTSKNPTELITEHTTTPIPVTTETLAVTATLNYSTGLPVFVITPEPLSDDEAALIIALVVIAILIALASTITGCMCGTEKKRVGFRKKCCGKKYKVTPPNSPSRARISTSSYSSGESQELYTVTL